MSEFDWVEARYNCTADKAFAALKEAVRERLRQVQGAKPRRRPMSRIWRLWRR